MLPGWAGALAAPLMPWPGLQAFLAGSLAQLGTCFLDLAGLCPQWGQGHCHHHPQPDPGPSSHYVLPRSCYWDHRKKTGLGHRDCSDSWQDGYLQRGLDEVWAPA